MSSVASTSTAPAPATESAFKPLRGTKRAKIHFDGLKGSRDAIEAIHKSTTLSTEAELIDWQPNEQDQPQAISYIASLDLSLDRKAPYSKWTKVWSKNKGQKNLFQCVCGIDVRPGAKKRSAKSPFPFNGCTAHLQVDRKGPFILRIYGVPTHSPECQNLVADESKGTMRPVHPEVYQRALSLMETGVTISQVVEENKAAVDSQDRSIYPSIDTSSTKWRWQLEDHDRQTINRKIRRRHERGTQQQNEMLPAETIQGDSPSEQAHELLRVTEEKQNEIHDVTNQQHFTNDLPPLPVDSQQDISTGIDQDATNLDPVLQALQ